MRFKGFFLAFLAGGIFACAAHAEDYVEPGRFGTEAVVTASTVQGGAIYVNDWIEAALDIYGGSYRSTVGATTSSKSDAGGQFRIGKRWNLGTYNYLVTGWQYTTLFGSDAGVSMNGTYSTGPSIGLQRHFSGTNLMLTVFIFPYVHAANVGNDGSGNKQTVTSDTFFTNGGFGLAYLF